MVEKIGATTHICGIDISSSPVSYLLSELSEILVSRRAKEVVFVCTPNPEQVVQAADNDSFRHILNQSAVAVPDGVGLVRAVRWLRGVRLERIAGVDLAEELLEVCGDRKLKVCVVGGRLNRSHVDNLKRQISSQFKIDHSKLQYLPGAEDVVAETQQEKRRVLDEIGEFKPDLLLVAYGAPEQEKWVWGNRIALEKAGVKVAMVVGGAVDVWSGRVRRAPKVVRKIGLEWLWRLAWEPWRWRRQVRLFRFMGMVGKEVVFGS